ncbi:MAG: hypothetical protein HC840_01010 [Leptolyngbyaceae cyanobacterium RM2_2_4]|nr:hypothetical protein [Leptolyngbyaceae cyanobacterium RM2_2_4]
MKIGKAKFGFTQKKYFKLKDGESTFRILPPLGELADEGRWSMFYKIHYGYKNTKGKLRVFQSSLVKNRKSGMIEVPDAADQRIKDLKAKLEEAKAAGNKAVVEKLGKLVSGQKPMYNVDSNHYLNVIDDQGNIGVLKLRHRAKTALDVQIKKLREKGVDPLSVDNGRYFVFTRSGTGLDTSFQVDIKQEKLRIEGVGEVNRDIVHKLSEELISRLGEEAAELGKLFRALTADEIQRIVDTTDLLTGQSPVIDELFDSRGDTSGGDAGDEGDDDSGEESSDDSSKASAASSEAVAAAKAASEAKAKADAAEKAAFEAKAAQEAKAKADAAAAATQAAPASTPAAPKVETLSSNATTAEAVSDMSDADFLKTLGL